MSDTNTDCDYEMTPDEACALEDFIQERMEERANEEIRLASTSYVLDRFNSNLR